VLSWRLLNRSKNAIVTYFAGRSLIFSAPLSSITCRARYHSILLGRFCITPTYDIQTDGRTSDRYITFISRHGRWRLKTTTMHTNLVKSAHLVREICSQTDIQTLTDVLITILRHCSRRRSLLFVWSSLRVRRRRFVLSSDTSDRFIYFDIALRTCEIRRRLSLGTWHNAWRPRRRYR